MNEEFEAFARTVHADLRPGTMYRIGGYENRDTDNLFVGWTACAREITQRLRTIGYQQAAAEIERDFGGATPQEGQQK
jgi:hypothetical protein